MKNLGGIFILVFSVAIGLVQGQKISPSFKFENLTNENGLSQASVTSIVQDSKGFIWIGTRNGLNKYDGYEFTIYQSDPIKAGSISDNSINCLYIDQKDRFWIGTDAGGLQLYDQVMDRFYSFDQIAGFDTGLGDDIANVFQDSNEIFWICTIRNGLLRWDEAGQSVQRFVEKSKDSNRLRSNYVKKVFEDREGRLWLMSDAGIDQILNHQDKVRFKHFEYTYDQIGDLPSPYTKSMTQDNSGRLWVASDGGMSIFDPVTGQCTNYQKNHLDRNSLVNNFVKDISIGADGLIWIATDQGINVLDIELNTFTHVQRKNNNSQSLLSNYVKLFFRTNDGVIWIGTDGGVSIFDPKKEQFGLFQFQDFDNPLSNGGNIYAVYQDQSNIWVGTDIGLFVQNQSTNELTSYNHDPLNPMSIANDLVKAITKDSDGNIWLGTDGGLSLVHLTRSNKISHFENYSIDEKISVNNVRCITEDDQHRLWIGTWGGGLVMFDLDRREIRKDWGGSNYESYGLSASVIWQIYKDSKQSIWVVTSHGISKYEPDSEKFKSYVYDKSDSNSLSSPRPICMVEDGQGFYWIGTMGGGLNRFDADLEIFEYITNSREIGSNAIYAILEDDLGKLWMSTSDGIVSYNPENLHSKKYTVSNGLQGKEYNINACYQADDSQMYFGGINGLNVFNPLTLEENTHLPKIYITEFQLFNLVPEIEKGGILSKSILETDTINLTHDQNIFSFKFVALNFRNSIKNQYAYMLEGFDRDWQYTTQNNKQANYTQIPPGNYIFRVKGSNDDALWNEEGVSLAVLISPPWWWAAWAKMFYVIVFVLAGPGLYFSRVRRLKKEAHLLEVEVEQRISEIKIQKEIIEERNMELQTAHEQIHLKNTSLEEMNTTLEEKVAIRTIALSEVVAELKDRNVNLEQFNYIISHNMRAPVANMNGLLQLYNQNNPADPFNKQLIEKLQISCSKLDDVLMDLTKILEVHHQIDRPREEIKIQELIEDIIRAIGRDWEKSKAEFVLKLNVEKIHSVRALWYSILLNLITNAIKYRKPNVKPIIQISTSETGKGTLVVFQDNGIGIDLGQHNSNVFGLYKRFHTHVEGKGMGLFMTKTQVESLGGTISIQSIPDEGTTFLIEC